MSLDQFADSYKDGAQYEWDNELILNWYPGRIKQRLKPGSLLELGLGHGYTTARFAPEVNKYTVLEGSKEVAEQFHRKFNLPNVDIVLTTFESYETEELFDNILMGFILEHVDDPATIINKFRLMLAPGGKLFITVPNSDSLHRRFGHNAGMLPDMSVLSDADRGFGHKRYFNREKLTELVTSCGMKVVAEEGVLLKPITTEQMKTLGFDQKMGESLLIAGVDYPELCAALLMELSVAS